MVINFNNHRLSNQKVSFKSATISFEKYLVSCDCYEALSCIVKHTLHILNKTEENRII